MGEIETVEAEKMGWLDLPRGTSYPTFPYLPTTLVKIKIIDQTEMTSKVGFNQAMKRVMPYTYEPLLEPTVEVENRISSKRLPWQLKVDFIHQLGHLTV